MTGYTDKAGIQQEETYKARAWFKYLARDIKYLNNQENSSHLKMKFVEDLSDNPIVMTVYQVCGSILTSLLSLSYLSPKNKNK